MVIFRQRGSHLAGGWSSLLYQLVEGFLHGVEYGLISYPPRLEVYKTQKRFLPLHVFLERTTNQLFLPKFQIRCLVLPLRFFFEAYPQRHDDLTGTQNLAPGSVLWLCFFLGLAGCTGPWGWREKKQDQDSQQLWVRQSPLGERLQWIRSIYSGV